MNSIVDALAGGGRRLNRAIPRVVEVSRISRIVADLDRSEEFYHQALGFRTIASGPVNPATLVALGFVAECEQVVMQLGADRISLVRCAVPGLRMPVNSRSNDLWFQHIAVVTHDMDAAYGRLSNAVGWRAITQGGPQHLPLRNGGVRAFKFRDPDGHPVELLWFPKGRGREVWQHPLAFGPNLGIDHTALAVSSTSASLFFYRALGFTVANRSLNQGVEQSRLDGLPHAFLRVIGLRPEAEGGPGVELLGYRPPGRADRHPHPTDIQTSWTTLNVQPGLGYPMMLKDPDGHRFLLSSAHRANTVVDAKGD